MAHAKKAKPKQVGATRGINFWRDGKTSFTDVVTERRLASNHEKNLLIVWWSGEVAEVSDVGVGEVLAGYKAAGWKPPTNPENYLQVTASQKDWLGTSDMGAIKTTHRGRNHVEHEMPAAAKTAPGKAVRKVRKRVTTKVAP